MPRTQADRHRIREAYLSCLEGLVVSLAVRPRVVLAADANEVLAEQINILLAHTEVGLCGCEMCDRYTRMRDIVMGIFSEPTPPPRIAEAGTS